MHRRSRWIGWVAVGAVVATGVSGCADEGDVPQTSAPTTSATQSAASDAEIAAAAEEAYDGFIGATNDMWLSEEIDYTDLLPWADDETATAEAAGQQELRDQGVVSVGRIAVEAFEPLPDLTSEQVIALVCLDFRDAARLDANGSDVTPADAVDFAPLRVRLESSGDSFVVTEQEGLAASEESPCP